MKSSALATFVKVARRSLFVVIFVAMFVEFFIGYTTIPFPHDRSAVWFFVEWIGAPVSMLVWCMLCLKNEPALAQTGLMLEIVYILGSIDIAMPN